MNPETARRPEIGITPEMLEAGMIAYRHYDPAVDEPEALFFRLSTALKRLGRWPKCWPPTSFFIRF